jgi:hypothetical protein
MHVLPRVAELHERFEDEVVVVGVHAGKYPAERLTDRIRSACARLGVAHPVVNDRQFRVWRSYAVDAWPTVVLVGPDGRVAGQHAGEFEVEDMAAAIEGLIASSGSMIDRTPRDFGADPAALPEPAGPLRFPGRLLAGGERLFVSDTGHHRILELRVAGSGVTGRSAQVVRTFGTGSPGLRDGEPGEAAFRSPQGLALTGETLLVADRANHAVRSIDLTTGRVVTVAGTGRLASGRMRPGPALRTALRSPWDLAFHDGLLVIAMAGSHQLWAFDPGAGTIAAIAGTGGEEIADGPAMSALLAQPMGVAASDGRLAFCDAESSAVRLMAGDGAPQVRTLVGTGLFDFGDADGVGDAARLQHTEALAWHEERLIVSDTYNDKLRRVDPATRECTTLPGGTGSGSGLSHPGGIAVAQGVVWVADTDNHRIVLADPVTGETGTLHIGPPTGPAEDGALR